MNDELLERFSRLKDQSQRNTEVPFDSPDKQKCIGAFEKAIAEPNFWSDQGRSTDILRQKARLEESIELDSKIRAYVEDGEALAELAREGEDVGKELPEFLNELAELIERVEFQMLLGGENDRLNGIVTIHPGAGGTEAQDWAAMLMRMIPEVGGERRAIRPRYWTIWMERKPV